MQLLTDQEIEYLHRRYAKNEAEFKLVYTHCQVIWALAQQLISQRNLAVDTRLVKLGALLHDIGVYGLDVEEAYIRHGIIGYQLLRHEGLSEAICRFASHHTGMGLTKQEIIDTNLPLPPVDYLAESPEEGLVMYADKFHSKSKPTSFNKVSTIKAHLARFGADKVHQFETFTARFGLPNLPELEHLIT